LNSILACQFALSPQGKAQAELGCWEVLIMINKTTEAAFRILVHLQGRPIKGGVSVQKLAKAMGGSPTYLAKVAQHLVRGGLLLSHRGSQGGLELGQEARKVPLLRVVELCQGLPAAAYCETKPGRGARVCGFHKVMLDLHNAYSEILTQTTVGDLVSCPFGVGSGKEALGLRSCRMKSSAEVSTHAQPNPFKS
jgi:Rrf2 family protein